ncbi:hypothetical protein NP233_g8475 [Leucocoprinus birnbaumii]|uniref:Uncharacterized protein n=1 Tax=Leucocoprinus birnbaumii TaxID=56174 RepID=A0AAD5VM99_9AGAR|nr:hypothetical protein NP233_g8475 [Leucocoprinus birnbaumii]
MWTFARDSRGNLVFPPFRREGSGQFDIQNGPIDIHFKLDWFTGADAKLIGVLESTNNTATNRASDGKPLRETLVITTPNADWLPQINLGTQDVKVYHDGRWGTSDFAQWPQWYFDEQDHFPYILRKPKPQALEHHPLRYLWFVPEIDHFVFMNGGEEVGRFAPLVGRELYKIRTKLLDEVMECRCPDGGTQTKLYRLANHMKHTTTSILNTPQSYLDAMYTFTAAQRYCLEVRALLDKITHWDVMGPVKKPRPVNNSILGCVTDRAPVVNGLYEMGVPVWYVRPLTHLTPSMTILKQRACTPPADFGIDLTPWPGCPSFYTGPLDRGIYKLLQNWQPGAVKKFPLEAISTADSETVPPTPTATSLSSTPYSTAVAQSRVSSKSSTKLFTLNKQLFDAKTLPHHPEPLEAWKIGLKSIDQNSEIIDHSLRSLFRGYAFPPPLIFSSPNEERNIDNMLAWILVRPSWISLVSNPNRTRPLPGPQQWRDFLNKVALDLELVRKDTRNAPPGTLNTTSSTVDTNAQPSTESQPCKGAGKKKRILARRHNIKDAIPEIFAFPIPSKSELHFIEWQERRVWDDGVVHLSSQDRKLVIWDSQEHQFRLELLTLDRIILASVWATEDGRGAREQKHKAIWPDGVCFLLGIPPGGTGMGAAEVKTRFTFIKALQDIVVDWPFEEAQKLRAIIFCESEESWNQSKMEEFEKQAGKLYCQQFFAHFGRPPCIPHLFPAI